ncbi:LxmA leader domain family RiPP [Microbispora sp. CA-135349]|uniref:LxmA leader domain family RiPP n=1 Tax=Microbispora sp. CA-135349 TaxID=3239953 RepID=UPI003D933F3A
MDAENLMSGADAYSSLAEVVAGPDAQTPEASPVIITASAISSFITSWNTVKNGC